MMRSAGTDAPLGAHDLEQLVGEHQALMRYYGKAQRRCSEQLREQASQIARLRAEAMRLRARVVVRDTALAWEREDRQALEADIPGLPSRRTLARRVDLLLARIQDLMRERLRRQPRDHPSRRRGVGEAPVAEEKTAVQEGASSPGPIVGPLEQDMRSLEASLVAADLVICRTGCLSHGAYWRVRDHCRRTGATCVLVSRPDALRIVHIHAGGAEDIATGAARAREAGTLAGSQAPG